MSLPTVPRDLVPVATVSSIGASFYFYCNPPATEYRAHLDTPRGPALVVFAAFELGGPDVWWSDEKRRDRDPELIALARQAIAERFPEFAAPTAERLPEVTAALAAAQADHHIAELARTWHALHIQYRAETEGHLMAATWARLNRARAALAAALDAEARS